MNENSSKDHARAGEVSEITGFEEQNLHLWDKDYDSEMKRCQEGYRGQVLEVSEGFIEFIVATANEYLSQQRRKKRLKIWPFMKWLNKVHRERMEFFGSGKSRRVITEILWWQTVSMKSKHKDS